LQIGLATGEFTGTSDLRPVNLSLVIDASGSMASENKLTVVKAALHTLVSNLRPSDTVSIVSFDDTARVVFPAGPLGNGVSFRRAIEGIQSGGGTNIDAGLMLGYEEALRNFKSNITNRVVLLTDGIANKGERDPRKIANNSSGFNERGIDLSTIGVGHDLDNDLLRTLAKRGRGLYHFVADPTDVAKVFALEAQSLLSAVARYVRVEVTSDSANGLDRVFGYEPRLNGERVSLNLDDLNSGATQVVLLRYRPESVENVAVRLTYLDIARQKQIEETKRISLVRGIRSGNNFLADEEVRKNYTIATIAQALNDMQESWQRRDFVRAENVLHVAVRETRERYPRLDDMDIHAQFEVANRYLATLQRFVGPRFD
jgi:secreted protein with Ig-like and vWFA domain